jgi:hypothetical protein
MGWQEQQVVAPQQLGPMDRVQTICDASTHSQNGEYDAGERSGDSLVGMSELQALGVVVEPSWFCDPAVTAQP